MRQMTQISGDRFVREWANADRATRDLHQRPDTRSRNDHSAWQARASRAPEPVEVPRRGDTEAKAAAVVPGHAGLLT
jgi:hypothetical protein